VVPSKSQFVSELLFEDELVAVLPSGHTLATRRWLRGEELAHEQLFVFDVGVSQRAYIRRRLFPRGGGFQRTHRVPLTEAIIALVRSGAGISILPRWSVEAAVARGELSAIRLTRSGLRRVWHGVYPRRSPLAEQIRTLLGILRRERATEASPDAR
jgi:LysR family transcriptional regulator for metE and metH